MTERHKVIPASYLILLRDQSVLLSRRYQTGFEDGRYSLVAGHVDAGETFADCIVREAEEEAGIHINKSDIRLAHVMHRKSTLNGEERVDAYFMASAWEGEVTNMEPHKCDHLDFFPLDALPENTIESVKQALEAVRKDTPYSEHGW